MAIPLGRPLPSASRDRPGWRGGNAPGLAACHPYLVLLPVGFALPPPLPATRCALTAPFHPCRPADLAAGGEAVCFCGTFPEVAPAGRYPAPCFRGARTFLSPPQRRAAIRPSGLPKIRGVSRRKSISERRKKRGMRRKGEMKGAHDQLRDAYVATPPSPLISSSPFTAAATVAIRARVSRSSVPSQRAGRKWRWNAVRTARVASSSKPFSGTS
jgi:hypothetical protein